MYSLDNQIDPYTDEGFNAEAEAQHFFKSYGEADIAKKLNEMTTIQQSIEVVLRQKVRANYGMFLLANDEIQQVDEEMLDLKHLVTNTQKLMDDVQGNRIAESRAMRTNSFLGTFEGAMPMDSNANTLNKAIADAKNNVPGWLVKAPEELAQFIVEQQYAKAVVIVLKTRAYVNTISEEVKASMSRSHTGSNNNSTLPANKNYRNPAAANQAAEIAAQAQQAQTQALVEVLHRVDDLCAHLATTIRKSVLNLPTSSLWGKAEQTKLLKLLIALEEFDMAAEGFAVTKVASMKRSLRSVESTGDTASFASELSVSFFNSLQEGCYSFKTLFEEHYDKPEILNLLLDWVQGQIASYVEILVPHMHAAISDLSGTVMNRLRKACAAAAASGGANPLFRESTDAAFPDMDNFYGAESGPTIRSLMEELSGSSPLSLLGDCLEGAFRAAHCVDSPQLQGSSCLGWVLMPEVQSVVTDYAERFLEQVAVQVRQDSWRPVVLRELRIRPPLKADYLVDDDDHHLETEEGEDGYAEDGSQHAVARSYEWLVAVLTHLSDELWTLLKAESPDSDEDEPHTTTTTTTTGTAASANSNNSNSGGNQNNNNNNTNNDSRPSYSRADLCEVEPVAVACMLRIFLRYILEVEGLTTKGFTKQQNTCYLKTLEAILYQLLPSLQRLIANCFFAEGVNSLHASPSYVFQTLTPRLTRLIKEKQDR